MDWVPWSGAVWGSYVHELGLAGGWLGVAIGAAALALAPPWNVPASVLGLALIGASLLVEAQHRRLWRRCRELSRAHGLEVAVLVPELPRLSRFLHRLKGFEAPRTPRTLAIHVDPGWRPPAGVEGERAARLFGELYRRDYDLALKTIEGFPVLLGSSTFNRHESAETRRWREKGWSAEAAGPLLPWLPLHEWPPGTNRAKQRAMFGAIVSNRPVWRAGEWRTRLFAPAAVRRRKEEGVVS